MKILEIEDFKIEITISFLKVLFIGIIELISPEYPLMLYL